MAGVGVCNMGTYICPTPGSEGVPTCVGWGAPQAPQCNGLDNDCDGKVDIPERPCYDGPPGTLGKGPCTGGKQLCTDMGGDVPHWSACLFEVVPQPEVCDGIDNDCDGIVDDNIPQSFCYTGPPNTVGVGQCHPGVSQCVGGVNVCQGEQLPKPDVCDGVDRMCDGMPEIGPVDVCFMIETAPEAGGEGTFDMYYPIEKGTSELFVENHASSGARYCVVAMPGISPNGIIQTTLVQDFSSGAVTDAFLKSLQVTPGTVAVDGTAILPEPVWNYDDLYSMATGQIRPAWRPGVPHYVVFYTMDEAESATNMTESQVAAAWADSGINLIVFYVSPFSANDFNGLTDSGFLLSDPITMEGQLVSTINVQCDAGAP